MGSIEAGLDKILALRLSDQWLQLGSGKGVDETGFRDDEQQHLCAGEGGQLVCLKRKGISFMELDELGRRITFFIMPNKRKQTYVLDPKCTDTTQNEVKGRTSFTLRESDMTSGFVLYELDFDLAASSFLVSLGLIIVVVVVSARVDCIVVLDERVCANGRHMLRGISHGAALAMEFTSASTLLAHAHVSMMCSEESVGAVFRESRRDWIWILRAAAYRGC